MIALSTGSKRAPLRDRGADCYETPFEAVEALMRVEQLPLRIWEPACGPGAIVRVLRRHNHEVIATDLVDYQLEGSTARIDFLLERQAPIGVEAVVTNPPYRIANQFAEHALELVPRVVFLLRLAFLESSRRSPILDSGQLARVYVFRNRLRMMHRAGWAGPRASSAVPFAWFCWDRQHRGPIELRRISWVPTDSEAAA